MFQTDLNPEARNYNRQTPFPRFQKPSLIGGFSLEQDRRFVDSRKYLSYLRLPSAGSFNYDLNVGYETYVPGPKETHLTSLLQFIGKNRRKLLDSSGQRLAADFVAYRGLLTQIFITPYFRRDSWSICATKFKGTIYLCNYLSPEKKAENESKETEFSKRCSYYGRNFERFILTDDPAIKVPPCPTEPLHDCEEFNIGLMTRLDSFKILYAAEVDGVDEDVKKESLDDMEFIEIKTRMADTTERQYNNYLKFKLPKWWCQSFLVGVEKIYCGFRTEDGHVKKIEALEVKNIPKMCQYHWSPNIMVQFGVDFLAMVHDLMQEVDCPYTVYQFNYDSNVNRNITYEVFQDKNTFSFLPETHMDLMKGQGG